MNNSEIKIIAEIAAKTARDFEHYFSTVMHQKLEEWISDSLKERYQEPPEVRPNKRFKLKTGDKYSKFATLKDTQSYFSAEIDIDDVPRQEVIKIAKEIVKILNENSESISK